MSYRTDLSDGDLKKMEEIRLKMEECLSLMISNDDDIALIHIKKYLELREEYFLI